MTNEAQPRVLVVDDDRAVHDLIDTLLRRAGIEPVTAMNATEAAQILHKRPFPNAIVLDLMLPDISGIEFLRQMREKKVFDPIPVVILSALADPDQIREGLNSGADRYITKPYLVNNLITTLNDVLKNGRKKPE